jgi:hypothetical protein
MKIVGNLEKFVISLGNLGLFVETWFYSYMTVVSLIHIKLGGDPPVSGKRAVSVDLPSGCRCEGYYKSLLMLLDNVVPWWHTVRRFRVWRGGERGCIR